MLLVSVFLFICFYWLNVNNGVWSTIYWKYSFLHRYTAVGYPDYVQYTALVDEIESIFTLKGL